MDLIDFLEGEQTYDKLKRNYFKTCLKAVQENAKRRREGINTRINALRALKIINKRATLQEIKNRTKKLHYDLNDSRIRVGLGTWQKLGIISGDGEKGYFIVNSFEDIIKKELK